MIGGNHQGGGQQLPPQGQPLQQGQQQPPKQPMGGIPYPPQAASALMPTGAPRNASFSNLQHIGAPPPMATISKVPSMSNLQQRGGPMVGGLPPTGLGPGGGVMMVGQGQPPTGLVGGIKPEQAGAIPAAFEKKLRRLEKNRESARECRRRKKEHVMDLQSQVARLEAENLKLKLELKVGEESEQKEREEKDRIISKLDEMVKNSASDSDIWQTIDMYKEKYSDYGSDRRSAINFHVSELEKLLLPTKLTKLCMWLMLRDPESGEEEVAHGGGGAALAGHGASSSGGLAAMDDGSGDEDMRDAPTIESDPPTMEEEEHEESKSAMGPAEIWTMVANELEVTEEQQQQLLAFQGEVETLDKDLKMTLGMLKQLRMLIDDKNSSLDQELLEIQKILTPTQTAKFILWVTQNPACIFMLNQLWSTLYVQDALPTDGTKIKEEDALALPSPLPSPTPSNLQPPLGQQGYGTRP